MNRQKADSQNPQKRKRHLKGRSIDKLPDELLIAILSRISFTDAARTSVLSSRWRYLWMFTSDTLEFDDRNAKIGRKMFIALVNRVLKSHQGRLVDSLIIRFTNLRLRARYHDIDSWIYSAMNKEVKRFELNLSAPNGFHCYYEFPSIDKLLAKSGFGCLRTLRLVDVDIRDEVVHYFLASCPFIEQLCIRASNATKHLEIVGPLPNLKQLEISDCCNLQNMGISVLNLVSCTYQGNKIDLPFKKTPNLSELTIGGLFSDSFIFEPNKHSSYSANLVKLVLNLKTMNYRRSNASPDLPLLCSLKRLEVNTVTGRWSKFIFFLLLIQASPNLQQFKLKIEYTMVEQPRPIGYEAMAGLELQGMSFPKVPKGVRGFLHKNLKVVEMAGYIGFPDQKYLMKRLLKVAPSLEMVAVDTQSDAYKDVPVAFSGYPDMIRILTRENAKQSARDLIKYKCPPKVKSLLT